MAEQKQLIEARDRMVKEISPLEQRSNELLEKVRSQEVYDDQSKQSAVNVKKQITSHRSRVKDTRLGITRQIDDVKKVILNKEKEVLVPLDHAQSEIGKKILEYDEEQERIRREEQERIDGLVKSVSVGDVYKLKATGDVDAKESEIKQTYWQINEEDRENAEVKAAFNGSLAKLVERRNYLAEKERQEEERQRLESEQQEVEAERDQVEIEKAEIAEKEREIEAEKERLAAEEEARKSREEAEKQRKAKEAEERQKPKSGAREYLTFEITDPDAVPREYCVPHEPTIRAAIKEGKEVPGVKAYREKRV